MNLLRNAIWRFIWQFTVGKSQTNVTNVTMPPLNQAIWRKCTVEKKETNAANVTLHLCGQTPWRNTWKCKLKFEIEIIQAMQIMIFNIFHGAACEEKHPFRSFDNDHDYDFHHLLVLLSIILHQGPPHRPGPPCPFPPPPTSSAQLYSDKYWI